MMMAFTTQSFLMLAWFAPMVVAIDAWRKAEVLLLVAQERRRGHSQRAGPG